MFKKRVKIGEILLNNKEITDEQLNYALQIQSITNNKLGEILIEKSYLSQISTPTDR